MSASSEAERHDEVEVQVNPVMHLVAPVAAIAVTMVVRKVVESAYKKATGHDAPLARDPRVPFMRAMVWTALLATTAAVAEVAVYRLVNQMGEKSVT